ncbi:MAG: hypothetical protein LBH04_08415 [Tannerellaceae bacterium]|jgi:glutathione synthase/RimK-type ligase-like ATP-grasp enzyme|nr:hypothetical protein [Tannerellaceae bacterium]
MKDIAIAGIRRGEEFSPGHIDNDATIFRLSANELRRRGWTVNEYSEKHLAENLIDEQYIFNMARSKTSIKRLQQLETSGRTVINSAFGIDSCTREKMTRILIANHIPHPESIFVHTAEAIPRFMLNKLNNCWIKRGDSHAVMPEDVTYVENSQQALTILHNYAMRGIPNAVINEHLTGDLVKFYGIAGTDFFHWFYPSAEAHSKFGHERINGTPKGIPFNLNHLRHLCTQAAEALNVQIYGGDAIICEKDLAIRIIDFNDWPSFAPCRNEAAPFIAQNIQSHITQHSRAAV